MIQLETGAQQRLSVASVQNSKINFRKHKIFALKVWTLHLVPPVQRQYKPIKVDNKQRFNLAIDILSIQCWMVKKVYKALHTVKEVLWPNPWCILSISWWATEDQYSIIWNFEHFSSSKHQYEPERVRGGPTTDFRKCWICNLVLITF